MQNRKQVMPLQHRMAQNTPSHSNTEECVHNEGRLDQGKKPKGQTPNPVALCQTHGTLVSKGYEGPIPATIIHLSGSLLLLYMHVSMAA